MRALISLALATAVVAASPADVVRSHFASAVGTPERPGASIVWHAAGRSGVEHLGRQTLPDGKPPADDSIYEIGSITKAFTGILLADMVLNGEVKLETTIGELLPGAKDHSADARRITLEQLATHSSGLPRLPDNLAASVKDPSNPYASYAPEHLDAFLRSYAARSTTPTPEYSNLGFGLLGYALALKAGKPYEQLIAERVLLPLGMRDTGITSSPSQRLRIIPGHANGKAASNWDIPTLAGAGALRSTAADMTKVLAAMIDPPESRVGRALRMARQPRADLAAGRRIGFGWITARSDVGKDLVWHNGGTGGYRTFIGAIPDAKVGLVVLTNATTSPDPIALQTLNALAK